MSSTTPTLDAMSLVQTQSQAIGEFIDWLAGQGLAICGSVDGPRGERYFPDARSIERLLADYFGIDLRAAEEERQAILDAFRN
jgi:hypothetical protein